MEGAVNEIVTAPMMGPPAPIMMTTYSLDGSQISAVAVVLIIAIGALIVIAARDLFKPKPAR